MTNVNAPQEVWVVEGRMDTEPWAPFDVFSIPEIAEDCLRRRRLDPFYSEHRIRRYVPAEPLDALEKMTDWISVKERLPEPRHTDGGTVCLNCVVINDRAAHPLSIGVRAVSAQWAKLNPEEYDIWFELPMPEPPEREL